MALSFSLAVCARLKFVRGHTGGRVSYCDCNCHEGCAMQLWCNCNCERKFRMWLTAPREQSTSSITNRRPTSCNTTPASVHSDIACYVDHTFQLRILLWYDCVCALSNRCTTHSAFQRSLRTRTGWCALSSV